MSSSEEVNTSSVLGLFKEIIIDHSLCGDELEENMVIVAACNPARTEAVHKELSQREKDLGKDWVSGHYQVSSLPGSVERLKWSYGSLNKDQEKEFIFRRLEMLGRNRFPAYLARSMTELISESQEAIRCFAYESILRRWKTTKTGADSEDDAKQRARSTVSLRDIQRVFGLYQFFSEEFPITLTETPSPDKVHRHSMLLSLAVVYYLRLDHHSRSTFVKRLNDLPTEKQEEDDLLQILNAAMDKVISQTNIPPGIALTRGLKENVFMTLVCSLSRTPLMIVGPPGSSKVSPSLWSNISLLHLICKLNRTWFVSLGIGNQQTLSVNTVSDNAKGPESPSPFYRDYARLPIFHYQCTKASTSTEVASVFRKAIERQRKVDSTKQKCLVVLDEAGLTEEEKESLKVLHYFLEGHMSTKAEVGFVAITNHILDAAKTNRCAVLLREEPDLNELESIARGVLFDADLDGRCSTRQIKCDGKFMTPEEIVCLMSVLHGPTLRSRRVQMV